jgi:hypothetical protein
MFLHVNSNLRLNLLHFKGLQLATRLAAIMIATLATFKMASSQGCTSMMRAALPKLSSTALLRATIPAQCHRAQQRDIPLSVRNP